jgi:malate dehydrogenase
MTTRIAIVGGGGGVGSSLAFNLLVRPEPYAVALVDGQSGTARSHAMDLQQVIAAGATGSVGVVALDAIADADVIVVSAAVPLTANRSRLVYLHDNAAILDTVTGVLARAAWAGVLLLVTNPIDPLVTAIVRRSGLDRTRVLGYTANDGLRLRTAVGEQLGVPPAAVDAWVLGEHGDHCVPLLSRVAVDGRAVSLTPAQADAAGAFVRGWYVRHVALDPTRSSTWTSGHGVARMVAAIAHPGADPWPASVVLAGEYGVDGVALTVPVRLGRAGVESVLEWELADDERAGMAAAADAVRAAVATLGLPR